MISSLYELADFLEIDRDTFSVEVFSRTEGGVVEWLKVKVSEHADKFIVGALSAFIGAWVVNYFNSDVNLSNITKTDIESAIALKEAGFTQEEAEALVRDNPKLMDFCSKYYKSAVKDSSISSIETSVENDTTCLYRSSIQAEHFSRHIVETTKTVNVVRGTTLKIASPVLADVKRLKWRGVYNQLPISFSIEDLDFIDKVHNREIQFEYGTTISCDLRIEETRVGNKAPSCKYIVEKVYSWFDGERLEVGGKKYLAVKSVGTEVEGVKLLEKSDESERK